MTHRSREDADSIQRDRGRVAVSMKLVRVHAHPGRNSLFAETESSAGSIVFKPIGEGCGEGEGER